MEAVGLSAVAIVVVLLIEFGVRSIIRGFRR